MHFIIHTDKDVYLHKCLDCAFCRVQYRSSHIRSLVHRRARINKEHNYCHSYSYRISNNRQTCISSKGVLKRTDNVKNTTKLGDNPTPLLLPPLPFQQLKTVGDISVTWYIRHGTAIGRRKSRGCDVITQLINMQIGLLCGCQRTSREHPPRPLLPVSFASVSLRLMRTNRRAHYRAMHFSAKRGIAIACRLSVCLSVTLVNCNHIGWNSSKIISPLVSLGRSLLATPT